MAQTPRDGYDPQADRAALAGALARRGHLRGRQRRPPPAVLRPVHVPVPERARRTWATSATTPSATCIVRYRTMNGHAVLCPMGFDSFGLPAENAAIKTGEHPRLVHRGAHRGADGVDRSASAPSTTGGGWSRATTPSYIRWTQWIFLRLLEAGLAYRKTRPVNWCPGCQTVLANEQVLPDGTCERSGDIVEQARPRAVVLQDHRLRRAAARRPRRPRLARAGQDHAAQLDRPLRGRRVRDADLRRRRHVRTPAPTLRVFTTRPDTSFGMTYCVLAPEHPLVRRDHHRRPRGPRSRRSSTEVRRRDRDRPPVGRGAAREAGRVHRRLRPQPVHRPARADLPGRLRAHGLRHRGDHGRARRRTSATGTSPRPTTCRSSAPSSRPTTGRARPTPATARPSTASGSTASTRPTPSSSAIEWLEEQGIGQRTVNYRLRDWLLSRQRFWGCPIPIVYCPEHGAVAGARRPAARCSRPTTSSSGPRASRRCGSTRASCTRPARCAAARPSARPTPWTPSSTRRGTSCASPTRGTTTRRSPRRRSSAGCRSTSTSAASSTPSCT